MPPVPEIAGQLPESAFDPNTEFGNAWLQGVSEAILGEVRACLVGTEIGESGAAVLEVIESQVEPFDQAAGQEVVNAIAVDIQRAIAQRLAGWLFNNWRMRGSRQLVESKVAGQQHRPARLQHGRSDAHSGLHPWQRGGLLPRFDFTEDETNTSLSTGPQGTVKTKTGAA